MVERGWLLGDPLKYDRELALYTEDCLAFVKNTQPKTWEKYQKLFPNDPEKAFIARVATQLNKDLRHRPNSFEGARAGAGGGSGLRGRSRAVLAWDGGTWLGLAELLVDGVAG